MSKQKNSDLSETFLTSHDSFFEDTHIDVDDPDDQTINKSFRTLNSEAQIAGKKLHKKISYSAYYRLLKYTKKHYILVTFGLCFLFLSQVGGILLPYISGQILDVIITTKQSSELNRYCLYFFVVFILSSVAIFGRFMSFSLLSERVSISLKNECFERFINFDIEFFDRMKTGELLSRLGSDIATLRSAIGGNIASLIKSVVLCVGCFVVMFILSWKLALVVLVLVPFFMIFTAVFSKYSKILVKRFQDINAESSIIAEECFSNIRTVKSNSTEDKETDHFKSKMQEAYKTAYKRSCLAGVYKALTDMVTNIGTIAVLWFGGYHVLEGDMTSGELVSFLIYSSIYASSSSLISENITNIAIASGVAEGLFELFDYTPLIKNEKKGEKDLIQDFEGRITFKDVCFSYPSKSGVLTLDHINLDVMPGEAVALCGASGGGKSTIVSLIERFYDINEGSILISHKDIRDYDVKFLHQQIGYVSQEPVLFSGTIEENITYGVETYTKKELYEVAKLANAFSFITDETMLPKGFDTLVGERGSKLSGGQKQRVAIARALMKKPKILIFDESTSALDADSEHQVQTSIDNLIQSGQMTVIIIAHRLSTIMGCKRIIVLNAGKIVEEGDHESLVRIEGVYKSLIDRQMNAIYV